MRKIILFLVVLLFNISLGHAQGPGLPEACLCCEDYLDAGGVETPAYTACVNDCFDGGDFTYCNPIVPLDSNILILFALGISFGTYSIYQLNKKRQLED